MSPVDIILLSCIGEGSSSLVYAAHVAGSDLRLVVKFAILSPDDDDGKRARVLQESTLYTTNLRALQGVVVPQFGGVYHFSDPKTSTESEDSHNAEVFVTILEDTGDPIGDEEVDAWRSLPAHDR